MNISFTIFVEGQFVDLSVDISDDAAQARLNAAFSRAMSRKLSRALRAGTSVASLSDLATSLSNALTPDDFCAVAYDDEVENEALSIAEADISARLARDGLPAPKSIRDHAAALVSANPSYLDRAKARLIARAEVVRETLAKDFAADGALL